MENQPKNSQKHILKIAVPGPFFQGLNYELDLRLSDGKIPQAGIRVRVPLRTRSVIGIILENGQDPNSLNSLKSIKSLKTITEVLDTTPIFSPLLLNFISWAADYYHYPIGDCFFTAMPKNLCQGKPYILKKSRLKSSSPSHNKQAAPPLSPLDLTPEQTDAIQNISKNSHHFQVSLIEGVTGSGKTEVYLQLIELIIQKKKQALVLVPEIGLTPQTLERFQTRFQTKFPDTSLGVLHSQQTETEKINLWIRASQGESLIIIGTRSALFTPFSQLGMIIIDEEHDLSFKQQTQWRYHARDLAIKRAQLENIPCILGTATPSLESRYQAQTKKYQHYVLSQRPGKNQMPHYFLIDLRAQKNKFGLTENLITAMRKHLAKNQQVLIFINRRGYAPALTCSECGYIEQCTRCDAAMTLHQRPIRLCCHHCGRNTAVPKICPQCKQAGSLCDVGVGTEKIEAALENIFPDQKIIRIDKGNTSQKGDLDLLLNSIHKREANILVGTQMIAKGHHFEHVSMVGIINIDEGLCSADFRAVERSGQLITQVAGRAGRAGLQGEVFIQTYQPNNPLLITLLEQGYSAFSDLLSKDRYAAAWPPYSYLAMFHAEAKYAEPCVEFLEFLSAEFEKINPDNLILLGPVPALIQKKSGLYRYHLLIQSSSRKSLQEALSKIIPAIYLLKQRKVRFFLDVDPLELA